MTMKIEFFGWEQAEHLQADFGRLPFSFSPAYLGALATHKLGVGGWYSAKYGGEEILMPVLRYRSRFLRLMTIQFAPCKSNGERLGGALEKIFLEKVALNAQNSGEIDRISQPVNWSLFDSLPEGAVAVRFGSFILNLRQSAAEIFSAFHSKNRNIIRRAQRQGVDILFGPDQLTAFHRLYSGTMERNGLKAESVEFFEGLLKAKGLNFLVGVAYADGRPCAAMAAPYTEFGAYYLFGGSDVSGDENGANNLLHYEAILYFKEQGCAIYDFVGARLEVHDNQRLEGIQRFKSRFGGKLVVGLIWKQDLSALRCWTYDQLLSLRLRVSGVRSKGDIIDQILDSEV